MNAFRWRGLPVTAVLFAMASLAPAQQNTPHIGYVYPAGIRQGSTFQVTVGGQFLFGVNSAYISGAGVHVKVLEYIRPMSNMMFNDLRDKYQESMKKQKDKAKWTPEDEKALDKLKKTLADAVRRPANAAIGEIVRLEVVADADAAPGERELRLGAGLGLTNPLVFCVGQLPEFSKPAAKVIDDFAKLVRFRQPGDEMLKGPFKVALPAVLNGQILPGGVDRYRFQAHKGQHLVIAAATRDLIPYISDAVPGWFQAFITLFDPKGKKVGYADHFRFQQDPLIEYEVAEDGEYSLEINDSIYRGREDFVYRITAGELPYVSGIYPLGGKAGSKSKLEIKGWNLPASKLTEDNKGKAPGIYPVSVRKGEWTSNQMPFAVDTLKESSEKETNDRKERAQKIKLPLIVNGRIDKPGDCDVFRFDGRAGQQVVAEVLARRLDSPLDSVLKLTDANGKQIAFNDDYDDKGMGLMTFQADSWLSATLPAKGRYYLYLRDREEKGGPDYGYRLRISAPRPDFELRITPASINARAGSTVPVTVYAVRKDGFAGDIALKLKDAPAGFSLDGGWIPSGQDQVRLTLTIPPTRMDQPLALHVEGRANIQGHEVTRPGVPAENMMQAFAYHHLVPAHDWMVRVLGSGRYRLDWKLAANKPVKVPAGGTAPVRVTVPLKRIPGPVHLTLNEPPQGIAIQNISRTKEGVSFVLRADSAKAKAGLKGNLIVDAFTERAAKEKDKPVMRTVPLGTLPAISFEIVASR